MKFTQAYIPYGVYWSSPFCKWQGSLAHLHALRFAADVGREALGARGVDVESLTALYLGTTVPQRSSFYGAPWLAALLGAEGITGPTISQACATSARTLAAAALGLEAGGKGPVLAVACDRTSNGPHLYHPNPLGPGGRGDSEDWVWDNFGRDPFAKCSMTETAENVAKEHGFSRQAQEEVALLRYEQYAESLKDDRAFQRRYMVSPEIRDPAGGRGKKRLEGDEGIHPATAASQAKLKPVAPDGTVTFATQTHPADGNAGMVLASKDAAQALARETGIEVQLLSYGEGRTRKAHMPEAIVPAAQNALQSAGVAAGELRAVKTHNPFAVNDLLLSKALEIDLQSMNRYGSSLIYGHPQGPTGLRGVIELIEELALAGGGQGLFVGCAAGDSAAACVIQVKV